MIRPSSSAVVGPATWDPELCDVCSHPLSAHDPTSLRWCSATKLGVGLRACICSGTVAKARSLTHY